MPRLSHVPAPLLRMLLIAAALLSAALLLPLAASAQDGADGDAEERLESIPPFPVVYLQGTATLDGAPVASGEIVVRVGDWERPTRIPVVDGAFDCASDQGCLLVGPPGYITEDPLRYIYVGEPVTFHLNGDQQADLTYPFAHMSEPCFVESVELRFGAGADPRTDQPCPTSHPREHVAPHRPHGTPTPTPIPQRRHYRPHGRAHGNARSGARAHGGAHARAVGWRQRGDAHRGAGGARWHRRHRGRRSRRAASPAVVGASTPRGVGHPDILPPMQTTQARLPLIDSLVPGQGLLRDAALVVGFAVLVALFAQIAIKLPFTPVPITGQTLAVLLTGGALGANRGAASPRSLLVGMVASGVRPSLGEGTVFHFIAPWAGSSDLLWQIASGGYIAGFIGAAWVVGRLAERGWDRSWRVLLALLAGNVVLYVPGLLWLGYWAVDKEWTSDSGTLSRFSFSSFSVL